MDPRHEELLKLAIDNLPAAQRTVIEGFFYERCGVSVIAERLGISTREVCDLRDKAFRRLRRELRKPVLEGEL